MAVPLIGSQTEPPTLGRLAWPGQRPDVHDPRALVRPTVGAPTKAEVIL